MEMEKINNNPQESKNTENVEQKLREMQLETQKENIEKINKEMEAEKDAEKKQKLEKEKEETEKKIGVLKNDLDGIYREQKIEEVLKTSPEMISEYRLAVLQSETKSEEIEKNKTNLIAVKGKLDNIRKILTSPTMGGTPAFFLHQKNLDGLLKEEESLKVAAVELTQEKEDLDAKINKLQSKLLGE